MPFIEKFSHGACISEWRFFPIKSIQFNSRIYKSNRLQQFHFIKCAQIQVSVRETKWRGLHPDAWHQKPSINDVCRLHEGQWSEDIEDVRISQSGLRPLSGPRRAQWLPPPAGRGQYSYGYPRKLMRKILGSILDSSDFFALSYFCTLQNVYEIWGVWQRPPVKISGNMLDIIKKAEIFWRMLTHESRIMADTSISTQTTPTTTPAQSTHSHTDTSGSSPMTSPWVNQMSICHKDNSDHNPPH